jgi:hypothetical protein
VVEVSPLDFSFLVSGQHKVVEFVVYQRNAFLFRCLFPEAEVQAELSVVVDMDALALRDDSNRAGGLVTAVHQPVDKDVVFILFGEDRFDNHAVLSKMGVILGGDLVDKLLDGVRGDFKN